MKAGYLLIKLFVETFLPDVIQHLVLIRCCSWTVLEKEKGSYPIVSSECVLWSEGWRLFLLLLIPEAFCCRVADLTSLLYCADDLRGPWFAFWNQCFWFSLSAALLLCVSWEVERNFWNSRMLSWGVDFKRIKIAGILNEIKKSLKCFCEESRLEASPYRRKQTNFLNFERS